MTLSPIRKLVKKTKQITPKSLGRNSFAYIDISSVDKDSKRIINPQFLSVDEAPSRARKEIKVNDVLVATVRPNLNGVAIVPEQYDNEIASTGFCVLRTDETKLDPHYLFYFTQTGHFVEHLTKLSIGAGYPAVSDEDILNTEIPLPPLPEQRRIADLLSRADHLRRLRRFSDTLSASLLQSVFLEMFGDPASNPKGWDVFYLAELCESSNGIKAGPFGSSLKKEIYTKSGYRIYGQEQVIGGSFAIGDYYISKEMFEKDFKAYEVKTNDVLISLVGTFGKTIIVPEGIKPGIINPRLLKISPRKDKLNSVYLAQYLQLSSVQKQFLDLSHGGTMGILNAGQLKEFKIICPPLPEQEQFAAVVRRVEGLRARQAESVRQGEGLFQSLLHETFDG